VDALGVAIRGGDFAAVERALAAEPKLARKTQHVVDAARLARRDVLALLLKGGADIDASSRGYRPLHALLQERLHGEADAPSKERIACLDFLLAKGADPEQLGAWPPARALIVAAFTGVEVFVERLIEAGAVRDGFTASALGDVAGVKRALESDPRFALAHDAGGLTALQIAAGSRTGRGDSKPARDRLAIAKLLLDTGADPNAKTKSWSDEVDVAYFAARDRAMLELVIERGGDATAALSSVVWNGDRELGSFLIAHGGVLDRAQHDGRPLLNDLIRWGQFAPATWMLEHCASPNLPDARGWTAVHQAASRGNVKMLTAVIAAGGDCSREDAEGRIPLAVANAAQLQKIAPLLMRSDSAAQSKQAKGKPAKRR
jgi:ankyrin repeat protein